MFAEYSKKTTMSIRGMLVTVKCNENAIRYWILQYIEHIEVLAPTSLRQEVGRILKETAKVYDN